MDVNSAYNQLLVLHHRSLPMYLRFATPWTQRQDEEAVESLQLIIDDQERTVDRLNELILNGGGSVKYGEFPMAFTGLHDLSLDYLLGRMIERQQILIQQISIIAERLGNDPMAQAVAQEILGQAKAHLESMQESVTQTSAIDS